VDTVVNSLSTGRHLADGTRFWVLWQLVEHNDGSREWQLESVRAEDGQPVDPALVPSIPDNIRKHAERI
jgi:hypothetical protein